MTGNIAQEMQRDRLALNLARFSVTGRVLWRLWHQQPDRTFLDSVSLLLSEWLEEAGDCESEGSGKGLQLMLSGLNEDDGSLASDYATLFVGPGELKAAPWGSVYLSEEQTTFGESTLAVRNFYRSHGMEIETGENEPEDHIGLMFAFVSWICEQGLEIEPDKPLQPIFCTLRSFLAGHVLTWSERLCELVAENSQTDFYRGLGLMTSGTLKQMTHFLGAEVQPVRLYR